MQAAVFNNQPSRFTAWRLVCFRRQRSPLFELPCVFARLDHAAHFFANANRRNFADRSACRRI